jgi:hypothetical protein
MWSFLRKCMPVLFATVYVPADLVGSWTVQKDVTPIGTVTSVTEQQAEMIGRQTITYRKDSFTVCGKTIKVKNINIKNIKLDEFLEMYGHYPQDYGFGGGNGNVTEIEMEQDKDGYTDACGVFPAPGSEILIRGNIVETVLAGTVFRLEKKKTGP